MDITTLTSHLLDIIATTGPKFVLGVGVFIVGKWLSRRVANGAEKMFNRAPGADASLSRFFASLIRYLILFMTIMVALSILGVNTGSFGGMVIGLGAAMAFILQDSLADLAAGVMMLLFRPFNVGDEVEIGGTKGVVLAMELTATRMRTRDNIEIIIQNSKAWGGVIRNHTALGNRRLDMVFGISYDANIDTAIETIIGVAKADPRVIKDPAPWAKVVNLGESSVDIELRIWAEYNDMRNLKLELSQPMKLALDAAGIGIPYPHEVKIKQHVKHSTARDSAKAAKAKRAKLAKLKNT